MRNRPTLKVDLTALEHNPYPIFERVRAMGGVAWVEPLNIWYVVGYHDVRSILMDNVHYSTGTDHSLLFDTFGAHMLTQNGDAHTHARAPFRGAFAPSAIRAAMSDSVLNIVNQLIDGFVGQTEIDLRAEFAARLPILSILALFGFSADAEPKLRGWYDQFERALANFTWDQTVRDEAQSAVAEFHALFREQIAVARNAPTASLLSQVVHDASDNALSEDEIIRNASIIFFGGISSVEALLLNTLYACALHGYDLSPDDPKRIAAAIDETMRWMSPVQSATRHLIDETAIHGITFAAGETVNCMLGAANRDAAIFEAPDRWTPGRRNAAHHLGFATGIHFCLGSHLAKLEVQTAITQLSARLPELEIYVPERCPLRGYEFRQPERLVAHRRA